jgi:hypothetical protein
MKILSVAIAGTAIALGTVCMAPVEAATVTNLKYSGYLSVKSGALPFLPDVNGDQVTIPIDQDFDIGNLSERLSDEGDTMLTIPWKNDSDTLSDLFPGFLSFFYEDDLLTSFEGKGSVFDIQNKKLSNFNFFYYKPTGEMVVDGYDFNEIQSCLSATCSVTGQGDVSLSIPYAAVNIPLPGTIPVEADINFNLTQTAKPLSPTETPSTETPSAPEPSFLLASLLAGGGMFAAKGKQKK